MSAVDIGPSEVGPMATYKVRVHWSKLNGDALSEMAATLTVCAESEIQAVAKAMTSHHNQPRGWDLVGVECEEITREEAA